MSGYCPDCGNTLCLCDAIVACPKKSWAEYVGGLLAVAGLVVVAQPVRVWRWLTRRASGGWRGRSPMSASCRFCGHRSFSYDGHECEGIRQSRELAACRSALMKLAEWDMLWGQSQVFRDLERLRAELAGMPWEKFPPYVPTRPDPEWKD